MTEITEVLGLDKLQSGPRRQARTATPEECAAVAARLGLNAVKAISFDLEISQTADRDVYEVIGQTSMTAERTCSVTNDPFDDITQAAIQELFTSNPKKATSDEDDIEADMGVVDIELVENDIIDLGDLVVQYLAMELDQSPRSPEAAAVVAEPAPNDGPVLAVGRTLPFAGLADMLRNGKGDEPKSDG